MGKTHSHSHQKRTTGSAIRPATNGKYSSKKRVGAPCGARIKNGDLEHERNCPECKKQNNKDKP